MKVRYGYSDIYNYSKRHPHRFLVWVCLRHKILGFGN